MEHKENNIIDLRRETMRKITDDDIKERLKLLSVCLEDVVTLPGGTATTQRLTTIQNKVTTGHAGYSAFAKALEQWESKIKSSLNKKMMHELTQKTKGIKK